MTNDDLNKFRGVVKEEINTAVEPIKNTLAEHSKILDKHTQILGEHSKILDKHSKTLDTLIKKLDTLWEQTVKLSVGVTEIKEILHSQVLVSNKTNNDIKKIDKRVTTLEDHLGLPTLPELTI